MNLYRERNWGQYYGVRGWLTEVTHSPEITLAPMSVFRFHGFLI